MDLSRQKMSYSKKTVTVAHRIGSLGTKYVTVVVVSIPKLIVEYIKNKKVKVGDSESLFKFILITENFKTP